jgi:hypothetical protein
MKNNKKNNWKKIIKSEVLQARFKLFSLFFLGFLMGVMFKSQAVRTIVSGFDDSKIFNNSIQFSDEIPSILNK